MNRSPHLRLLWVYTCAPVFTYSQPDARYLANTCDPSTGDTSTGDHSTDDHSTCDPSTCDHSACHHSTGDHSACDPSTGDHSVCDPSTSDHSACDPSTGDHSACDPSAGGHSIQAHPMSPGPSSSRVSPAQLYPFSKRSHRGRDGRTRESQIYCPDHRI